jgi:hypothetical protein
MRDGALTIAAGVAAPAEALVTMSQGRMGRLHDLRRWGILGTT